MNTALIKLGYDLVTRIIDKKKAGSKTNVATAAGLTMGTASYMTLMQSEDPVMVFASALLMVISAGLTLYKEKQK